MDLLRACHHRSCPELARLCPTRWAAAGCLTRDSSTGKLCRFGIDYDWGEKVGADTILAHGDVLDAWWMHTRRCHLPTLQQSGEHRWMWPVEFRWVGAHQAAPKHHDGPHYRDWLGNDTADHLAKLGATIDRTDRDSVATCRNYPLYRNDPTINLPPKLDPRLATRPLLSAPIQS